jgi:hypothetical protein
MESASLMQRVRHTLGRYFSVKHPGVAQIEAAQLGAEKAVEASARNVAAGAALIQELQELDAILRGKPDPNHGRAR